MDNNIQKNIDNLSSSAKDLAQETSKTLQQSTSALKDKISETATDLRHKVSDTCCETSDKAIECIRDKPIHAAIGFSLLGFLLGVYCTKRRD